MCFHLYEESKTVKFMEARNRMVAARGWGRRLKGLLTDGYEVSVMQDEYILEIERTTLCL